MTGEKNKPPFLSPLAYWLWLSFDSNL